MEKIVKEIKILKTLEGGQINYNMVVSSNIDRDELIGILTAMIQNVTINQQIQPITTDKQKPSEYIG